MFCTCPWGTADSIINLKGASELSAPICPLTNEEGDRFVFAVSIYASCPHVVINSPLFYSQMYPNADSTFTVSLQMRGTTYWGPEPAQVSRAFAVLMITLLWCPFHFRAISSEQCSPTKITWRAIPKCKCLGSNEL